MKKMFFIFPFLLFLMLFLEINFVFAQSKVDVVNVKGFVQIQRLGENQWSKIQEADTLSAGDSIRSFLESSATLIFPDASEFTLGENSSLEIKDVSQNPKTKKAKRELKLNVGSLRYKVPPQEEKLSEFKIHSSTSIVGITGTQGVVQTQGDGRPSHNYLIEGATYNTDDEGQDGTYQEAGNIYSNDGDASVMYTGNPEEEAKGHMPRDEELMSAVEDLVNKVEAKKAEGYDVFDIEKMIDEVFVYLEDRNYEKVQEMIFEIEGQMETVEKIAGLYEEYKETIDVLTEQIKMKEQEGFNVSEIWVLLEDLEKYIKEGSSEKADNLITQINQKIASLVKNEENPGENDFLFEYERIQTLVLEKESKGFSLDEIKEILRQAYIYYETGNNPKAFTFLQEAEEKIKDVFKEFPDSLRKEIENLKNQVEQKKQAGFQIENLELLLDEIYKLIEDESFIRVKELIEELKDKLSQLHKGISADWEVKLNALEKEIEYLESLGYDLSVIDDDLIALEKFVGDADEENIEIVYNHIHAALDGLTIPQGFEEDWKNFQEKIQAKEQEGYDLKDVRVLMQHVEAALGKGDINQARTFLAQAKEKLKKLEDTEPPRVEILTFQESEALMVIEGFASDNVKVESVTVNQSAVKLLENGKFTYQTVPSPEMKEIVVMAKDIAGNVSPAITLMPKVQGHVFDEKGEIKDVHLKYSDVSVFIDGSFLPGGKVAINEEQIFCDDQGKFIYELEATDDLAARGVKIIGTNSDGSQSQEVILRVEDKWLPNIEVDKVTFSENVAPTLEVDPLSYTETTVKISGHIETKMMVTIDGHVSDRGGTVHVLQAFGRDVTFEEDGTFSVNHSLTSEEIRTVLYAEDAAGNSVDKNIAFDAIFKSPSLFINDEKVLVGGEGQFNHEITLSKELVELIVQLLDDKGTILAEERFPISDVLPPKLEITEVKYTLREVIISGNTDPHAQVRDKSQLLFTDVINAQGDGSFVVTVASPSESVNAILVATNMEGKVSEDVPIHIEPLKDNKSPDLYVSEPKYKGSIVSIQGFVEDDYGIESVTVDGETIDFEESGKFQKDVRVKAETSSIEIIARDISGNETKKIVALDDHEPPVVSIDQWDVIEGKLVIKGKATDNIGVAEVRLDNMPLVRGDSPEADFAYEGILDDTSADAVITAVDLFNNQTQEGPREIQIPQDTTPPLGVAITMDYGSPVVYVSGKVQDPAGIKAVYVNSQVVQVFDDGSFNVKVDIQVDSPEIAIEAPSYEKGKVNISGRVKPGVFDPAQIVIEAEDLMGNRGEIFRQGVEPYKVNEINVFIDGEIVEVTETGNFSKRKGIEFGKTSIVVEAVDPFENAATKEIALETNAPILNLNPLEYKTEDKEVVLIGVATDSESGLYTISVNGIRVDFNKEDGSFFYQTSMNESSLGVEVSDYIGNVTSMTKDIRPPDIWPPVFSLKIKPKPAIIGKPVYIEVIALDSKSKMPENLNAPPKVTANVNGTILDLVVEGEGSSFMGTLDTTGLVPTVGMIGVEGTDQAGNMSTDIEGKKTFTLVAEDQIAPSFSMEANPDPIILGEPAQIKIHVSEEMKTLPSLEATLPSQTTKSLALTKVSSVEFMTTLNLSLDEPLGHVLLTLTGGEDLSGNQHATTQKSIVVIAPKKEEGLALKVNYIEFVENTIKLRGQTASEAVVHVEVGAFSQDVIAGIEGKFQFEKTFAPEQVEEMYHTNPFIKVKVKAHNYAGFESPTRIFDVDVPSPPEEGDQKFKIVFQPPVVEQGGGLNIIVETESALNEAPKGIVYLPDGRKQAVVLSFDGRNYRGGYDVTEDAPLGQAMFEVVSGVLRQSAPFEIVLSSQWMQRIHKDEFYLIRVVPDPLIIGKEAEIVVDTKGDLSVPPTATLQLPGNKRVNVPLAGGPRSFQGRYLVPEDLTSGRAEIILNQGTPEEVRRPCGVEDAFVEGKERDVFLFSNPNPLMAGEGFDVKVNFSDTIDFKPNVFLKLNNGSNIEIPLEGTPPQKSFSARFNLPADTATGLATFIIKDDLGKTINRFPTNVIPPFTTTSGVDIFVFPDVLKPMDRATIQINSQTERKDKLSAQLSFANGSKTIVAIEGSGTQLKGNFQIPEDAPFGMGTISVFDSKKKNLGTARIEIVQYKGMGAPVHAFLDNPDFRPSDHVRLIVDAGWPLSFRPKAKLIYNGGDLVIALRGNVPGNHFDGEFLAPKTEIQGGRIEIRDDKDFIIANFPVEPQGEEGQGELILNPMPPIVGQPLNLTVIAPMIVDNPPSIRLILEQGKKDIKLIGALPGDTFNGTLSIVEQPIMAVEVIDPEGRVVEHMPLDMKSAGPLDFDLEIMNAIVPGQSVNVMLRSFSGVPFVPRLQLDFSGKIIDVPLRGVAFGKEFNGKFTLDSSARVDSINAQVFDPQGRMVWQRLISSNSEHARENLYMNVMPHGSDGFDISWDTISGAAYYQLNYGPAGKLESAKEIRGQTNIALNGLISGTTYDFEVVAFDSKGNEITRSPIVNATCGILKRQIYVQDMVMGNEIHLLWDNYPGADMYRVGYGYSPGNFSNNFDVKETSFVMRNLTMGQTYFIKVFALSQGQPMGESRDIVIQLMDMSPSGVDIFVNPDLPQIGSDLEIGLHFFNDIYFIPRVLVRLENGMTEFPPVNGEKRDFKSILTSDKLTSNVLSIEVEDNKGQLIEERPFASRDEKHVEIFVHPDPPEIGNDIEVMVKVDQPVSFIPRIIFNFVDGKREFPPVEGTGQEFRAVLSGDQFLSSLMAIDVEDDYGMHMGDRFFAEDENSGEGPRWMVNPLPPIVGGALDINIELPQVMPLAPKVKLNFFDGSSKEYNLMGNLPGKMFDVQIPQLEKSIVSIDLLDPFGAVRDTFFITSGGPQQVNIFVNPDPSILNQDLTVGLDFSQPASFIPKFFIEFHDGQRKDYTFSQAAGMMHYEYTVPGGDIDKDVLRVVAEDDRGAEIVRYEAQSPGSETMDVDIIINPFPPIIMQDLQVRVESMTGQPFSFVPLLGVEFANGLIKKYSFSQGPFLSIYSLTIPGSNILNNVRRVFVENDQGMFLGELFVASGAGSNVNIVVNPDPPQVNLPITVQVMFDSPVGFIPKMFVDFAEGMRKVYTSSQGMGLMMYEFTVPAGDVTDYVNCIGIEDDQGQRLNDQCWGGGGPGVCNIFTDFDPPELGQPLKVTAEFPENIPFIPKLFVEFQNGNRRQYPFSQPTNMKTYETSVPQGDMISNVMRIEITDDMGESICDHLYSGTTQSVGMCDVVLAPEPPIAGNDLTVTLNCPETLYFQPKVFIALADGHSFEYSFSTQQPESTFTATIPSSEIYQPVDSVKVQDDTGNLIGDVSYDGGGSDMFIYLMCQGDTAIEVSWDYYDWINSYEVYYGTSPGDYGGAGSPVNVGNITSYQLTDLTMGETYYIRVKGLDYNGNVALESLEEFVTCTSEVLPAIASLWNDPTNNPGEIIVRWDAVTGVDGYRVFYGLSSNSYTDYQEVYGANNTQGFLSGLNSGQVYYINVKTFTNDGRESNWYDTELVTTPGSVNSGTGILSANPLSIEYDNAATGTNTTTESVTLTNESSNPIMVRYEIMDDLINPSDSSTITKSHINVDATSYNISGHSSVTTNIYVSVPSTGVNPGSYIAMIRYYIDENENTVRDTDESFVEVDLELFFGADGIKIGERGVEFGNVEPNSTTSWANFSVENTSAVALTNIRIKAPTLINFSDNSKTISASNVDTEINSTIPVGGTVIGKVRITIPGTALSGEYGGMLMVFNDVDNDTTVDSDEPLDTFGVELEVNAASQPQPITDIRAVDRGTGGTVDLYWTDPNDDTEKYNIYYSVDEHAFNWNNPYATTTNKAFQVTGLTNDTLYFFAVIPIINGSKIDDNYGLFTPAATPTNAVGDTVPPTFAGLDKAFATGANMWVKLEWNEAQDTSGPITYYVYRGTDSSDLSEVGTTTDLFYNDNVATNGTTYYYMVRAQDNSGNMELNNKIESATPYGPIDHVEISVNGVTGSYSSTACGSRSPSDCTPVLVKLEVHDAYHNVITSFNDSINITVSESSSRISESWLLSVQDRVTGKQAEVDMYQGVGYFTIDTLEPEILTIGTSGIAYEQPLEIDFAPSSYGTAIDSYAVQGPSKAVLGVSANDGALVWISAIDSDGKVYKSYDDTVVINLGGGATWTVENGGGTVLGGGTKYDFIAGDNGEVQIRVKDGTAETVSVSVTDAATGTITSNSYNVDFVSNVDKYLIKSSAFIGLSHEALGNRIKFTLYAANSSGEVISGYNGVAEWTRENETIDNDSSYVTNGSNIAFTDGVAEFYLDNSEYETVTFNVSQSGTPSITTGSVDVIFQSVDTTPPTVTNVVAETPYLVHLYFSEEIDSDNALIKSNYTGIGNIRTVCWYNDNVTLHLDSPLSPGNNSIDINGDSPDGIKDKDGNFLGDKTESFDVPYVDYQGGPTPNGDWFEIQVSDLSPNAGDTVRVTIYHKNACGYLTGSNRVNKTQDTNDANIDYTYGGSTLTDTTVDISSGEASYDLIIPSDAAGGSINIDVSEGNVTGSAIISVNP